MIGADVHIWRFPLDQPLSELSRLSDLLSADESERAGRFRDQRDRNRFVAARGVLRAVLGRYLDLHPAYVQFTYAPLGKPSVNVPSTYSDLTFNISHSDQFGLLGLTRGRPIGIDLERVRTLAEVKDLASSIFSEWELTEFRRLSPTDQESGFFNAWTRKEAFVKATGMGFSTSVKHVEVTFAPGVAARLVSVAGSTADAAQWTLRDVPGLDGYKAAFAVAGRVQRVSHKRWELF